MITIQRDQSDKVEVYVLEPVGGINNDGIDTGSAPALSEVLPVGDNPTSHRSATRAEFITAKAGDAFCNQLATSVSMPCSFSSYDRNGILVRQSKTDGAVQTNSLRDGPSPHSVLFALPCHSRTSERTTFIRHHARTIL